MSSSNLNKNWVKASRLTYDFLNGVWSFIEYVKQTLGNATYYPCNKYRNVNGVKEVEEIRTHLITYGIDQSYTTWYFHGEFNDTTVDAHIENPNEPFITQHDDVVRPRTIDLVDDAFGYMQPEGLNEGAREDGPYVGSSKTKIRLRFSLLGHVVGKNSTKFMSNFGNLVREYIPPYYIDWLAIPLKLKDTVWETICMEVNPTITRSDSFLVGHTRSDGTFPMAFVEEKVKAENDARFENLKDMVASLRSFGCATTSTVNVKRSRISTLLQEKAVAHFLNFHEHIVTTGKAFVLPGLQESDEAKYEVIVDIIFEENSPIFGQRGVFFDERLTGMKIKYPWILLHFAY
ncbi:hypothetical protein GIB67_039536 [Kingdonia uniflora]|uniref:Transposase-associated domain-containing protein n=1 Tax=Kingdonia uniflora TaxID=39325 RepID=A0A7J7LJ51_9MAGN|nr:hypothetical protein GIB67_039536 [Kingdonia uniflora]